MLPPGHAAVGYLLAAIAAGRRTGGPPDHLTVQLCVLASLAPDLVDKLLAWGFGVLPGGRTLLHSLLVLGPLCALAAVIARHHDRTELGLLVGFTALSHPLIDALPALWDSESTAGHLLWPIVPVETVERSPPGTATIQELLVARLTAPWFLLELGLVAVAIGWWYHDGFPGLPRNSAERRRS